MVDGQDHDVAVHRPRRIIAADVINCGAPSAQYFVDCGAHVAGPEDRDTFMTAPSHLRHVCRRVCGARLLRTPFARSKGSLVCEYPPNSTQRKYSDKWTNRKPRLRSFGSAAWIPSAVPWSGRFMCAKTIEPGVLLSIAATTWAVE
jgi:hypothetical protein